MTWRIEMRTLTQTQPKSTCKKFVNGDQFLRDLWESTFYIVLDRNTD